MKKLLLLAVIFTPSFSFAQSSGMVWKNGAVLSAQQLQQLDNAKINTSRIGAANGVAPLDANKMMSAPVSGSVAAAPANAAGDTVSSIADIAKAAQTTANGAVQASGGDASKTVVNGVQLQDAVNECQQSVPNVFYGAVNSSSQMGVASNTEHLRASGNVLPYFNTAAIAATIWGAGGATYDISGPIGMSGFQNVLKTTGVNGIFETSYNQYLTPDIPSKYYYNLYQTEANGGGVIDEKTMLAQTGFKPAIVMVNLKEDLQVGVSNGDTTLETDADVQRFATAMKDYKENIPSAKYIWPWISGNNKHNFDASDPWWANSIKIMKMAGGVGLDMPAGLSVKNGPDSIAGMVAQIKWANANGIKTLILLSPYAEDTPPGYGTQITPQWRYDKDFASHVKTLISWFVAADALPTAYAVVNYSPTHYYDPSTGAFHGDKCATCKVITANYMGADNDSVNQTVSYVARWVAENAPTSPYTSMPDMGTSLPSACATTVMGGYKTTKSVISTAQIGLGSLAYQDYDKTKLQYPSIYGAQVRGNFDFLGQNALSFGAGILSSPAMFGYVQSDTGSGLMVQNAPFIVNGFNLNITNGGNLALQGGNILAGNGGVEFSDASGNNVKWISSDHIGGINIGPYINVGNNISFKSDVVMDTSDILMNGTHGIQFQSSDKKTSEWIAGDGQGGINIGEAVNVAGGTSGTATFNNGLSLANTSGTQATVGLDTSGNTLLTSKSGIGIVTTNARTFKVENGNVDLDNSQIVSDSTGNLGLQTVRLGGLSSPQYIAAPNKGTQGMIIHGADDYHTINIGYDIADAFGNLIYAPNTESHLLYSSSARPAVINMWSTDGQKLENLGQIAQKDTIFNTHNLHIGRDDAITGAANLLFHSAGTNIPSGVIAVKGGTSTPYQGDFTLYGKSFSFNAPVTTTATISQNDNSTTLVTSAWVQNRLTPVAYANLPSSPYDWQEVICTDCYTTTAANTGVRGIYNPTRKAWTDTLGNLLVH